MSDKIMRAHEETVHLDRSAVANLAKLVRARVRELEEIRLAALTERARLPRS